MWTLLLLRKNIMANKNNCKCLLCKTEYYFCPTCNKTQPSWKRIYDSENCMIIFNTVGSYLAGSLTKEEAKARLQNCDFSDMKNYNEKISKAIKEITKVKYEQRIEPVVEPVVEETVAEPVIVEEPTQAEETTDNDFVFKRKKKYDEL